MALDEYFCVNCHHVVLKHEDKYYLHKMVASLDYMIAKKPLVCIDCVKDYKKDDISFKKMYEEMRPKWTKMWL